MSQYVQKGFRKTMFSNMGNPHALLEEKYGEDYKQYRKLWEKTLHGETELDFPIHLDIELNPSCNMMCPMCVISAETNPKSSKKYWVKYDDYCKLIDEGIEHGLRSVQLNNINEPLMRKDIPEFISYAREAGVLDIMLSTNGTALTKTMSERLIKSGLTKLSVSIDAIEKETYDKIRVGGDYDKVLRNSLNFLEVRDRLGEKLPLFKVTFVKSPLNESELDRFVEFWNTRADLIAIQNINNPFDDDLWDKTKDYFALNPEYVGKSEKVCPHPFQRMSIQADGEALLCCNLRGPSLKLGNVLEHGLKVIYNGDIAKNYRKLHSEGRYKEIDTCKKCIQYSTIKNPDSV